MSSLLRLEVFEVAYEIHLNLLIRKSFRAETSAYFA
jgi:hypothetical protein